MFTNKSKSLLPRPQRVWKIWKIMRINIVDVQKNTRKIRKTQQKKSSEGKERKIEDVILPPFYYIFVYQSNSINIPESFFTYRIVYPISHIASNTSRKAAHSEYHGEWKSFAQYAHVLSDVRRYTFWRRSGQIHVKKEKIDAIRENWIITSKQKRVGRVDRSFADDDGGIVLWI